MTDLTRPTQSDFITEMQRLHDAHLSALKGGDPETIQAAVDDLSHFLRMNNAGRLGEYMAQKREREA